MRRPTIALHVRLTAIFAAVFLVAGAALLIVNYSLMSARLPDRVNVLTSPLISSATVSGNSKLQPLSAQTIPTQPLSISVDAPLSPLPIDTASPDDSVGDATTIAEFANMTSAATVSAYRAEVLTQLLQKSLVALLVVAVAAALVGLLLTRRLLRPVQDITRTAQLLGEGSLDERLTVSGPRDELRELGETFNEMLDRLAAAIGRERRLMASVSHELRSPLANQRIALEVGLADEQADSDELRALAETALGQNLRAERLMESMLVLAKAEDTPRESNETHPIVDLADVVRATARDLAPQAEGVGVQLRLDVHSAPVSGDELLLTRLVGNLLENAVRHNTTGGWVVVRTGATPESGTATLEVSNSGPVVPPEAVPQLTEPFRRLGGDRVRSDQGVGLGLAIVTAIVRRSRGTLEITARDGGGLDVQARLPMRLLAAEQLLATEKSGDRCKQPA